jgi:hypothetical protein
MQNASGNFGVFTVNGRYQRARGSVNQTDECPLYRTSSTGTLQEGSWRCTGECPSFERGAGGIEAGCSDAEGNVGKFRRPGEESAQRRHRLRHSFAPDKPMRNGFPESRTDICSIAWPLHAGLSRHGETTTASADPSRASAVSRPPRLQSGPDQNATGADNGHIGGNGLGHGTAGRPPRGLSRLAASGPRRGGEGCVERGHCLSQGAVP